MNGVRHIVISIAKFGLAVFWGSVIIASIGCKPNRPELGKQTLIQTAQLLGTKADWDIVRHEVYCGLLAKTRHRSMVEIDLSKLGEVARMQQANPKQWTYSFANAELLAELSVIQVEFDQDEKVREVFWLDADSAQDRFEFIRIDCSANHHR